MNQPAAAPSARRVLVASLIGTAVEFYDFYIYATAAALVFGPLFFPSSSPSTQLLSAFASLGIAFIARPIGSLVFGHFGDRLGRKSTLVASLLVMGASTLGIAFLPTYASAGVLAPVLLCLLRFGQGFGLGGEWAGAALLAVENAPPGYRARFGMVPQLGAPVGFIAANGFFLVLDQLLTPDQFRDWGWRVPFMGSVVLIGVGLWVRLRLTETPAFKAASAIAPPPRMPMAAVLQGHALALFAGAFAVIACHAIFYISTAFALGYGTTALGFTRTEFLSIQLIAILFLAIGIVASGVLSDRFTPQAVLSAGCALTVAIGFLLAPALGSGSAVPTLAYLSAALFLMGLTYGPLSAWLTGLFPVQMRYSGAAMAFGLGGIMGGALSPVIAAALAAWGGLVPVGLYLSGAGLLSLMALQLLSINLNRHRPAPLAQPPREVF